MAAAMGKMTRDSEPLEDIAQRWSKIKKVSKIVIKILSLSGLGFLK
jgi:hypothetical protein